MAKRDRKRTPADRLDEASKRWSAAFQNANTSAERLAAAYDWHRAATRYAADLGVPQEAEMARNHAAKALAQAAHELTEELYQYL